MLWDLMPPSICICTERPPPPLLRLNCCGQGTYLRLDGWDERLAPESRIHTHDENEVEILEHLERRRCGCARIEHDTHPTTCLTDRVDEAMEMGHGFNVDREMVAPRIDVLHVHRLSVRDHEVRIECWT